MYELDILNHLKVDPKILFFHMFHFIFLVTISSLIRGLIVFSPCVFLLNLFYLFDHECSPFIAESKHYSPISHVAVVYLMVCLPKDKESTTTSYSYGMSDSIKINLIFYSLLF